jgi:hypothetical protein
LVAALLHRALAPHITSHSFRQPPNSGVDSGAAGTRMNLERRRHVIGLALMLGALVTVALVTLVKCVG